MLNLTFQLINSPKHPLKSMVQIKFWQKLSSHCFKISTFWPFQKCGLVLTGDVTTESTPYYSYIFSRVLKLVKVPIISINSLKYLMFSYFKGVFNIDLVFFLPIFLTKIFKFLSTQQNEMNKTRSAARMKIISLYSYVID